ncbi:hypothetical protein ACPPVW_18770 [Leifsonia sp. McL0607]|uniref:hypothetical protein n=1 Tax=Leifsonia sp. McL0607 TaxID=3415672 RepID=UPI003CF6F0F8
MTKPARGKPGEPRPRLEVSVESIVPPGSPTALVADVAPPVVSSDATEPGADTQEKPLATAGSTQSDEAPLQNREGSLTETAPRTGTTSDAKLPDVVDEGVKNVTVALNPTQQARAKMAVVRTGPFGGPASFSEFMRDAIDLYLDRLAQEYNDGEPFEPYRQQLKRGRPFK